MIAAAAQSTSTWGFVFSYMVIAFITGLLARFAVPGPDPMPAWLTIVIGLLGALIGSVIVYAIEGHTKDHSWAGIASFFSAIGLVIAYRRFVQKRPIWGPDAYLFPKRGIGVERQRERLRKAGIDPDQIGQGGPFGVPRPVGVQQPTMAVRDDHPGEPTENPAHYLGLLEELHDSGVLDDAEYDGARSRLLEKLR